MLIEEMIQILDGDILSGDEHLKLDIKYGYGCDLMSDVLAYVKNNVVLLTGLVHPQVIRTAEMLDIKAVIIVRRKTPSDELIAMAKRKQIALLTTKHSLFTACSLLFENGLIGEELAHDEITV